MNYDTISDMSIEDRRMSEVGNLNKDLSGSHSTLPKLESTDLTLNGSTNGNDFKTQAALVSPIVAPSTNIVNVKATYDIGFRTTTAGAIKTVEMQFPTGTFLQVLSKAQVSGLGAGTFSFGPSNTLIYTVTSAVNVPANTQVNFVIGNLRNPLPADIQDPLAVTITTKDSGGTIIDGPTPTNTYVLRKIDTAELANNAVTTDKIEDNAVTAAKIKEDLVHVVWHDNTPGNFDILHKRDGAGFDPTTVNLSNNAGFSGRPSVGVSGNDVYVVWRDETSGNNEIFYKRSTDGGANFDPTINLSNNAGFSFGQVVTASGNNVYVVWSDNALGTFEILYKRSTDGGANFDPTINLSDTGVGVSFSPAIAYYDTQL